MKGEKRKGKRKREGKRDEGELGRVARTRAGGSGTKVKTKVEVQKRFQNRNGGFINWWKVKRGTSQLQCAGADYGSGLCAREATQKKGEAWTGGEGENG